MKLQRTRKFKAAYQALSGTLQLKADKALVLIAVNPSHPSLHLKKMRGVSGIWEARVDRGCRMTLEIRHDVCLLRNIGKHDETLADP